MTIQTVNHSIRKIAKECKINYSTLLRHIAKLEHDKETEDRLTPVACGYQVSWLVFSPESESEFASYLRCNSEIMFVLTPMEVQNFAYEYECALKFNRKVPDIWTDWFSSFLKQNMDL